MKKSALQMVVGICLAGSASGGEPTTVKLWEGGAPGEVAGEVGAEGLKPNAEFRILENVAEPRITLYPADKGKNTGTAVIVCPGGGYTILADEHEGSEVCTWLNGIGVNGVLLHYRVPQRKGRPMWEAPLQDVQRALRVVRMRSGEWGIDPNKVGVLGFSAGGHLTLMAGTRSGENAYEPEAGEKEVSVRPDFLVAVYPAYLIDAKKGGLVEEMVVGEGVPPVFFAHAGDDEHSAEGSARLYVEWRMRKVPAEIHVYAKGGHGFGMRDRGGPVANWPERCGEWMGSMGWVGKAPAARR